MHSKISRFEKIHVAKKRKNCKTIEKIKLKENKTKIKNKAKQKKRKEKQKLKKKQQKTDETKQNKRKNKSKTKKKLKPSLEDFFQLNLKDLQATADLFIFLEGI